jgi:outer membrane cobalamin receptor
MAAARRKVAHATRLGLVLGALFPPAIAAQHPPVLEGQVLDRMSGAPVSGARVTALGAAHGAVTDARGAFTLRGLDPGTVILEVRAPGYRSLTLTVEARNGQVSSARAELSPAPVQVAGLRVEAGPDGTTDAVVLERAELDALGSADLAVALQQVPGVVVTRRGGPGSPASLSIRGGSGDQALVLFDGVPVNAPLTGGVDLSTISLDAVERITVLTGVQSARFGPRALSGVVLIDGRGAGGGETRAAASTGSWGSQRVALGLGGGTDGASGPRVSGRISGAWRRTDGNFGYAVPDVRGGGAAIRLNADARTVTASGSGRLLAGDAEVRVLGDLLDVDRGMPGPVTSPTPTARQVQRRVMGTAAATVTAGPRWSVSLDGQRQEVRFADPAPPAGSPYAETTVARGAGSAVTVSDSAGVLAVEGGIEGRLLDISSSTLVEGAPADQRSLGAWFAATGRTGVGEGWSASVSGALRVDGHTALSGAELSPRLAASLSGDRWTLRASVGSGFSPPSPADQYFQEGVLVRPNPALEPERVKGEVVLGADLELLTTRSLSIDGTLDLYRADVEDMILWFPDHRFVWSPDNFDVRRRGWEAGVDLAVAPARSRLRIAAARSSVEYATGFLTGQVAYRPEWTANVSLASSLSSWSGELSGRYVGTRRTVPGSALNALGPYWLWDIRTGLLWRLAGWAMEGRLSVLNVLGAEAAMIPDYPLPGRAWGLELSINPNP